MSSELLRHTDTGPAPGLFSGDVLHDLGHGLFALSCLTESVLNSERLSAGAHRRIAVISDETARLLALVRQASAAECAPKPVDVVALLECAAQIATQTGGAAVKVRADEPVLLVTDELSLWRVITNLVGNAARAAGPGGEVELSAEPGPPVTVAIADNGPGFGRGPQGWAARGLRIVSEQAGAGGAQVRFEDRTPQGTCVRLVFATPAG